MSTDSQVRLSWTSTATGFVLEQVDQLSAADQWSPVLQAPQLIGQQLSVVLSSSTGVRFFRLASRPGGLPPDPVSIAPPIPQGVATLLAGATEFLYTGPNPIQTGVAPGTIEAKRAAVVRGKVRKRDNTPLSGVAISILNHPELGQTISRADGMFDLAVNGGGLLTVKYAKTDFCPVQRQLNVPWQDYARVQDVVMIQRDPIVTAVALGLNSPMQVHRGSMQTDADGSRKATLLFPPGTSASVLLANGATQSVSSLSIRATEYTVGTNGPAAMPAILPANSGYTYAVELSADEAVVKIGGKDVLFSQPVFSYQENFIGFPVGTPVPVGFYDGQKAAWVPSENGRVIKILNLSGGFANVDTDGDGNADTGEGITEGERQQLGTLYAAGQSLWRVPLTHFSTWDYNYPYGLPDDATTPDGEVDRDQTLDDSCEAQGSIIECENQVLGDSGPIVGTPHTLNYRSNRVPGRAANRTLNIKLSGASVPASLQSIQLHLAVAGQTLHQTFAAAPNQQTTFVWDGLDAYGRLVQGSQLAVGSIDYVYPAVYKTPAEFQQSFAQFGAGTISGNRQTSTITISLPISEVLGEGYADARKVGLGGWTLSGHHFYDPVGRVLHTGDGRRRSADSVSATITTVAGNGNQGFSGDGGPATQASLSDPEGVAVASDGSLFIADSGNTRIRRVGPDGIITTVAGNGSGFSGDGGPATQATLRDPGGVAVASDGSVFIADTDNNRIRRVGTDGIITTVAGTGPDRFSGDGGLATLAELDDVDRVAVSADGSFYIADSDNSRIRRVGPDGIITTVAGNGAFRFSGDGGLATLATLWNPQGVALGADGSLYIADTTNHRIRRVRPDGIITTVAGIGTQGFSGDGGPATQASLRFPTGVAEGPDGSLYIADEDNDRIRRVGPDGIITTVAGNGTQGFRGDGGPATQAALFEPESVAVSPDGSLYIADSDNNRIRRVNRPLPGFSASEIAVPSSDGGLLYQFDSVGRHLRTLNALTGATLLEFDYNADGRLSQVTEKTGGTDNVTTILHDGSGNPTAIIGTFGQQTTLAVDANGFLASISNPAGEQMQFASSADGLLTRYTDPRGKISVYRYDADGRLIHDADPAGGSKTLARVAITNEFTVTLATALNRVTTYQTENLPGKIQRRTITQPDGTESRSEEAIDAGTTHATSSDGTISDTLLGPDPRFGMQSPTTARFSLQFPSKLQFTSSSTRSAVLANATDPLSLVSMTNTTTVDGRTTTNTYTAATRTFVNTTPAGRTQTFTLDALGRFVQGQHGNLDPVRVEYDNRGRLGSMSVGSVGNTRSVSFSYNAQGFLKTVTDPIGRTAHFIYDAAGRITSKTLPDGRVLGLRYDAAGNLTSVTPPGRPAHTLGYSDRDELTLINPPAVPGTGPTAIAYDADGAVTNISRAGVQQISINYDAFGRPVTRKLTSGAGPTTTGTFRYDSAGRTTNVLAASGVNFSYEYDGLLPIAVNWSGPVAGRVARTYDQSLRLASESVNGANTITNSYDNDGLLIGAGSLAVMRDPQHGLPIGRMLGVLNDSLIYNGFGEVTNYTASASGSPVFSHALSRDGLGRITLKVEAIGGVTDTYTYAYDLAGQLTTVTRNGATTESYAYDARGNRTNATVAGVTVNATYDDQERLAQYGNSIFTYNAAGDLASKNDGGQTTNYDYDALGNLLGVTLPSGTAITYIIDGQDRRVGKRVNGTLVQGLLYEDSLKPAAELDGTGAVVSRFVYAGRSTPTYMIKGGVSLRLISDQVGSVRLVVNSATGAIVQRLDYDSFGNVVLDTNPGFQPFGFAGGLYDPDTLLVQFGARDYDPAIGRWAAKDPIVFAGFDSNLYRYVGNDPVNFVDPTGLSIPVDLIGGVVGALLDSYTMVLPLLNGLDLFFDINPNSYLPSIGIDVASRAYVFSHTVTTVVGAAIACPAAVAASREQALKQAAQNALKNPRTRELERRVGAYVDDQVKRLPEAAKEAVDVLKGWKTGGGGSGIGGGGF